MRAFRRYIGHNAPPLANFTPRARLSQVPVWLISAVALAGTGAFPRAAQDPVASDDLPQILLRVGHQVQQWYARAQTIVSRETVLIQPLRADLTPVDFPRQVSYELRVAWDPERKGPHGRPEADVLRDLLNINGRAPREGDAEGCMDPKPVSPEPLTMLLPERLAESEFSFGGASRLDDRPVLLIDYRGRAVVPPDIRWKDDCVTVALAGRSRGRLWVDAETYEVLRMSDRLVGSFEFDVPPQYVRRGAASSMVIERAESTIRYTRVQFDDPRETLMLPEAIDSLTVIRGSAVQRFRISQRLTNHRRFLTGSRLLY